MNNFLRAGLSLLACGIAFVDCIQAIDCCEGDRYWIDAEYLYWQIEGSPESVILVNEGTTAASTVESLTSTAVLGGKGVSTPYRSGGRFALGYWFDDGHCYGVEANYFFLPSESKGKSVSTTGEPGSLFLGVPFYNVVTPGEDVDIIGDPTVGSAYSGLASYKLKNSTCNAELNALISNFPFYNVFNLNITLLGGFRYWNFNESFKFKTSSPTLGDPLSVFQTNDRFNVQNNFYGGQLGIAFDYFADRFFMNLKGKVALGANNANIGIHGNLLTNDFDGDGTPQSFEGGVFALPTNIGSHSNTVFSILSEANINFGYEVTDFFCVKIGYTFIYVSKAFWAGKQIDREINTSQAPGITDVAPPSVLVGQASPRPFRRSATLWIQGVNVGIGFKF